MHRLAVALLHDGDLARDIVHDVFVSLLDASTDSDVSGGYLIRAVRNRCLSHIRDCGIHERILCRYFLELEEYDSEQWPDEETMAKINALINCEISPRARQIINLRFQEGMPFAKVAATLGISESVVYRHLNNALKTIRLKLKLNG